MPVCPECHSRDLVRFGLYNNQQKWHCNNCGLTTIRPLTRMPVKKTNRRTRKNRQFMTMYRDYPRINNQPMKAPYMPIRCKYCGSHHVIKYGTYHGHQRFWCKDCERKFADNDALPEMQTPVEQVGAAISIFYEGQSLNSIVFLFT